MNIFSKALVALAAVSMSAAPVMAQAPTAAAALSIRSGAEVEDANALDGGYLIPALVVIAIIAAIILLTGGDDDEPTSP